MKKPKETLTEEERRAQLGWDINPLTGQLEIVDPQAPRFPTTTTPPTAADSTDEPES